VTASRKVFRGRLLFFSSILLRSGRGCFFFIPETSKGISKVSKGALHLLSNSPEASVDLL